MHATGSSLACPDWPLCYGDAFPEMVGGVLFEHSHRLLATLVGLCTMSLAAWLTQRTRGSAAYRPALAAFALVLVQGVQTGAAVTTGLPRPALVLGLYLVELLGVFALTFVVMRRGQLAASLSLVAFALVVGQGLLGGVTVVLRLPFIVSTAHLGVSLAFFSLLVYLTIVLRGAPREHLAPLSPRWPVALAAALVWAQCVLGALVRHTASGLACGTMVLTCMGSWVPGSGPGWLHFSHRLLALVVGGVVLWAAVAPLRRLRTAAADARGSWIRRTALLAIGLVVAQVTLGVFTVLSMIHISLVTTHLGVGALLLVDLVALFVGLGPLGAVRREDTPAALPSLAQATS